METIIYSVRISIKKDVEHAWVLYMKQHVLEVINTQCFKDYHIRKLLPDNFNATKEDWDENYSTYVIEYHANSISKLEEYFRNSAESLQKDHSDKFKGQYIASRSIMRDQFEEWFELMSAQKV